MCKDHLWNRSKYQAMAELAVEYYLYMHQLLDEIPRSQIITLNYVDLVNNTRLCVEQVYQHFDLQPSNAFLEQLQASTDVARSHKSQHHYQLEDFGLSKEWVFSRLRPVFEHYGFEK